MTQLGKAHRRDASPTNVRKVLIVDDHPMIQRAIAEEIQHTPGWTVCGEASDWNDALELAQHTQPDIAVVDLRLEAGHGLELIRLLRECVPHIACLVYSMLDEKLYAPRALEAGARGYLNKRANSSEIIEALRTVADGGIHLSESLAERLGSDRGEPRGKSAGTRIERLSDREIAVFELIGEGKGVHEIATQLTISPKTVHAHRQSIKRKLELDDNVELSRFAIEWSMNQ